MEFRWHAWNIEHVGHHGVSTQEAEEIVHSGRPLYRGDGKYLVQGRGSGGRWLQVIYVLDEEGTVFVIHARPLADREKRRLRNGLTWADSKWRRELMLLEVKDLHAGIDGKEILKGLNLQNTWMFSFPFIQDIINSPSPKPSTNLLTQNYFPDIPHIPYCLVLIFK